MRFAPRARFATLAGLLLLPLTIVHTNGPAQLGASPSQLATPFTTEEAWIVDEIVRDIAEMSAYPGSPARGWPKVAAGAETGLYTIALDPGEAPIPIDLRADV